MKSFLRRAAALILGAATLCSSALASEALGSRIYSYTLDICDRTTLTREVMWSASKSDLRTENYVTYTPSSSVSPVVSYGSNVVDKQTVYSMAKGLERGGERVLSGINGDYFVMATGDPLGLVVTDGVLRSSASYLNALGFNADGSAVIGTPNLSLMAAFKGNNLKIADINKIRPANGFYLFTDDFASTTKNTQAGVDVILAPNTEGQELKIGTTVSCTVEEVIEAKGATSIPQGKFVMSISNKAGEWLQETIRSLEVGDTVDLSISSEDTRWNKVVDAVGAMHWILRDGIVDSSISDGTAAPRTAVGVKPDGSVIFYTIDGRQSGYSIGATLTQVAERMIELGCVTALSLDGGGSTALVATQPDSTTASLVNKPSGGSERAVTNHLFLVADSRPTNSVGHVYLESESTRVLPNAQVKLTATALDTNYIPMANSNVSLRADKGTIDGNILTAPASGTVTVTANAGGASAQTKIDVITQPDSISVRQNGKAVSAITLSAGETATLTASAMYRHLPVLGDNKGFTWTVQGNVGTIENGVFTASGSIGSGSVTASLGRISVTVPVTVTARALRTLDGFETSFATATGTRAMLSYNSEMTRVHNGYASARLDYAIGSEGNAYIGLNYAIPSNYDQLNFWVYGDNSGAQLALVTDTGSVNLGTLNFSGWKLLTANLGAATAITGMVVSSDTELISAVYLDQLVLSYGGLTDTTAPKLSLQYNAASNTVTGTVKDDIDGAAIPTIRVTYDGKSYTSYTYDQSSGALSITLPAADGAQHRVSVVAGDASGNLSRAGVNAGTSSATPAFADMQDHWANDAVAYLKRSGISNGSNGNFLPDTNISRQEFAVLLARYLGSSQDHSSVQLPFADTNEIASWALNGAKAMYSLGIIKGSSDGSGKLYFNPTANVSRQEAVTMLGRLTEKGYAQGALKFTDSSAIQSWAAEYVSTLSEMGILTGFSDGCFRPGGAMTRAQVATVLYKF